MKRKKPIDLLMEAMATCASARGEAQWIEGYRAAREERDADDDRLYTQEQEQWRLVGLSAARFRRLALRLLREAKADGVQQVRRRLRDE